MFARRVRFLIFLHVYNNMYIRRAYPYEHTHTRVRAIASVYVYYTNNVFFIIIISLYIGTYVRYFFRENFLFFHSRVWLAKTGSALRYGIQIKHTRTHIHTHGRTRGDFVKQPSRPRDL